MLKTKLTDKQIQLLVHIIGTTALVALVIYRSFNFLMAYDYKDYYQWARCINLGMLPYKDFNMLQTPLSAYVEAAFFRINSSAIVMHLIPFSISTFITLYFAVKTVKLRNPKAITSPLYVWAFTTIFVPNALYNIMSLMFWAIALYIYFSYRKEQKIYKLVLIGLLMAVCFYTKQNIAAYAVGAFGIIFIIGWVKTSANKQMIVKELTGLWTSFAIGIGIGVAIFYKMGNSSEFVEYTLFPAKDFTVYYTRYMFHFVLGIIVLIALFFTGIFIGKRIKETDIGVCLSLGLLAAFPIINPTHLICSTLFMIMMVCVTTEKKRCLRFSIVVCFVATSVFGEDYLVFKNGNVKDVAIAYENKEIVNINTGFRLNEDIGILEYLKDKDVSKYHIIDDMSGFYSIYFDRYDKYYDLFLEGNTGKKSFTDIVSETINNEKGNYFIVINSSYEDYKRKEWIKAINYIKENCELEYVINENYSVYKIT